MAESSQVVRGYHGTSRAAAELIVAEGFRLSENDYDWLGKGVYFFQDSFGHAADWAAQQFPTEAVVISATIELEACIDMIDSAWAGRLRAAYDELAVMAANTGLELPRQSAGAHRLDRAVIEYVVSQLREVGFHTRSVRAAFPGGRPLYPGSGFSGETHVQIAVRDISSILDMQVQEL